MNNSQQIFAEVARLDEEAIRMELDAPKLSLEKWEQARSLLQGYCQINACDQEASYLLSYISYMLWARNGNELLWEVAVEQAKKSLTHTPKAKFFLFCLFFEKKEWDKFFQFSFSEQDRNAFEEIGQDWRYAKVIEMRFAAMVELNKGEVLDEARILLGAYQRTRYPDVLFPITAGNALEKRLLKKIKMPFSHSFLEICGIVKECSIISDSLRIMTKRFPFLAEVWEMKPTANK